MTPVWGWIVAYVLGFLLFQLLIYWYLQGDDATIQQATPDYGDRDSGSRPRTERRGTDGIETGDLVRCRHCGTENEFDPSYTYCRECGREFR